MKVLCWLLGFNDLGRKWLWLADRRDIHSSTEVLWLPSRLNTVVYSTEFEIVNHNLISPSASTFTKPSFFFILGIFSFSYLQALTISAIPSITRLAQCACLLTGCLNTVPHIHSSEFDHRKRWQSPVYLQTKKLCVCCYFRNFNSY